MRRLILLAVAAATSISPAALANAGTCGHAYQAEAQPPPAFAGVTTGATGFRCSFWGWGASPTQHGSASVVLADDSGGIAVAGLLWANAAACSGPVAGTALLVEAQTTATGGKLAIVALVGAEVNVDVVQAGSLQSAAHTMPVAAVVGLSSGSDGFGSYVDARLAWPAPSASIWALSNVPTVHVGYSLYFVTAEGGGPVDTGDRTLFTRVQATPSGSLPYVTDDPDTADGLLPASRAWCTTRVRPGQVYYFALSMILDGSAATTGDPEADPSAVETHYSSACSQAVDATAGIIFADGFESGTSSAWSATTP